MSSALARPPPGSGEGGVDRGSAGRSAGDAMLLFVEVRRGAGPGHVAGRPRTPRRAAPRRGEGTGLTQQIRGRRRRARGAGRGGGGRSSGRFRRGLRVEAAGGVKGTAVTFGERRRWARPEGDARRGASHRERLRAGTAQRPRTGRAGGLSVKL